MSRVVEVAPIGRSIRGSGYIVSGRLVLTAGHVATSEICEIRRLHDHRIWHGQKVWSGLPRKIDAALLEVIDNGWPADGLALARFGRLISEDVLVPALAHGFPDFQLQPDGMFDLEQLNGVVAAGTLALGQMYQVRIEGQPPDLVTGRTPHRRSPWGGFSGAALRSGGLVIGVLVQDPGNVGHGRLTAVPAYRLVADDGFRDVCSARTGRPVRIESVELAPLVEPIVDEVRPSPASLLRAQSRVVQFHAREKDIAGLLAWCEGSGFGIRLIHGVGGQGKTRIADELAGRLQDQGWVGGFVIRLDEFSDLGPEAIGRVGAALEEGTVPTILVVDYAETIRDVLPRLMRHAQRRMDAPLRVLILARAAGEWWQNLVNEASMPGAETVRLEPLQPTSNGRVLEYGLAMHDIADALNVVPDHGDTNWPALCPEIDLPDLSDPRFGHALTVHMTALADLLQRGPHPVARGRVEDVLLNHEVKYWQRNSAACRLDLTSWTLRETVAAATMFGAQTVEEEHALVHHLPGLAGKAEDEQRRVVTWLEELYPRSVPQGWQQLEPDRLGEHLITEEIRRSDGFVTSFVDSASPDQLRRALTVACRAATHASWLDDWIVRLLSGHRALAVPAVEVAVRSEHPEPLVRGLTKTVSSDVAPSLLAALDAATPEATQILAQWAVDVSVKLVQSLRYPEQPDSTEPREELGRALHAAGQRLSDVGRGDEAVTYIKEAIEIVRGHLATGPSRSPADLAAYLNTLSKTLHTTGHHSDAVTAAIEASDLYRTLADARPTPFLAHLADALNTLSIAEGEVGHADQALAAIQESVSHYRSLAHVQPKEFRPRLADSLDTLSAALGQAGRPASQCLAASQEAVTIYRDLADEQPDAYLPSLANALNTMSVDLQDLPEEAIAVSEESVAIFRQLAKANPGVFLPDLAMALNTLSIDLDELGRSADALAAATESVEHYRQLATSGSHVFAAEFANALNTRAEELHSAGQIDEALADTTEAVSLFSAHLERQPHAVIPEFHMTLMNHGRYLGEVGRRREAVEALAMALQYATSYQDAESISDIAGELAAQQSAAPELVEQTWATVNPDVRGRWTPSPR